jgi:hypothetical protein
MTSCIRTSWRPAGGGPRHGRPLFRNLRTGFLGPVGLILAISIAGCSLGSTAGSRTTSPTPIAIPRPSPTPGFSQTGSMAKARDSHTATLLYDGRVLIAGGPYSSAELYDPAAGTFSPTGSMTTARSGHTATLLSDGRVLIAGGDGFDLASAELYSPAAGTFSPTGSMTTARSGHTATLLADGRVLIAGGGGVFSNAYYTDSAELYDPATGTFRPTGSMTRARSGHTATRLTDGRVLITAGRRGSYLGSAELYDPATGTFSPTGSMATARESHTATLLADGRVLIVGGSVAGVGPATASAELYQP